MPSPIAHLATGYAISAAADKRLGAPAIRRGKAWRLLFILALSLAPDADAVWGILLGDLGRYHNNFLHSLAAGMLTGLGAALAGRFVFRDTAWRWFLVGLLSHWIHVGMDALTVGRGVMLLWPFTASRFQAPFRLFYGLHWSDGLFTVKHFWTLLNEVPPSIALVLWTARRRKRRGT